ncbi:MAG: iron-containing alcohol dehydrogenase [Deltaproteobacteria bacterium]|nr:iron-containing alcohol dehydrogenase [Deltaproteobacteria bacterium]
MSDPIVPSDFPSRTRIVFGPGRIDELGSLAREWSARRALLVTDPTLTRLGHAERARAALTGAGIEVVVFDAVRENPDSDDVDACLAVAREANVDTLVGLGGGSSLDTAKGCNFLLTNGGRMADYWGRDKATRPMLPMIAVPTTAGTGSECQSFALIADASTHAKMACGDTKAAPRIALLDPVLTLTQPRHVTADTGVDTLTHALEAAVTTARTASSSALARHAFTLAITNLPLVLDQPNDLEARGRMQLAAAYAGLAIEGSMLGAAHSAANPLTAHHGVVHGRAVGLTIAPVIRHNAGAPAVAALYAELALAAGLARADAQPPRAVHALLDALDRLLEHAGQPRSLPAAGVERPDVPALAAEAARQWTARFNPRPVSEDDFARFYRSLASAGPT